MRKLGFWVMILVFTISLLLGITGNMDSFLSAVLSAACLAIFCVTLPWIEDTRFFFKEMREAFISMEVEIDRKSELKEKFTKLENELNGLRKCLKELQEIASDEEKNDDVLAAYEQQVKEWVEKIQSLEKNKAEWFNFMSLPIMKLSSCEEIDRYKGYLKMDLLYHYKPSKRLIEKIKNYQQENK